MAWRSHSAVLGDQVGARLGDGIGALLELHLGLVAGNPALDLDDGGVLGVIGLGDRLVVDAREGGYPGEHHQSQDQKKA